MDGKDNSKHSAKGDEQSTIKIKDAENNNNEKNGSKKILKAQNTSCSNDVGNNTGKIIG